MTVRTAFFFHAVMFAGEVGCVGVPQRRINNTFHQVAVTMIEVLRALQRFGRFFGRDDCQRGGGAVGGRNRWGCGSF